MKERNSKKSEVMAGRAKCESLQFQAEWLREKAYGEVKTMLGKPVLKLKNMIVEFGRVMRE